MNEWVWSVGGMILTGETEVLGEKPVQVPLIHRSPEWTGEESNRSSAVRGRWLTFRAIARPVKCRNCKMPMRFREVRRHQYWREREDAKESGCGCVQYEAVLHVLMHYRQFYEQFLFYVQLRTFSISSLHVCTKPCVCTWIKTHQHAILLEVTV
jgi:hypothetical protein